MSAVSTAKAKKIDPLSKKIPVNPKYKNVKPTVNTGASLTRYMQKIDHIKENYKYRKDEIFKRMKLTTFSQLILQVADVTSAEIESVPATPASQQRPDTADAEVQNIQGGGDGSSPVPSLAITEGDFGAVTEPESGRSTLLKVSQGVGEMDLNAPPPAPINTFSDDTCPYLLLDVRDSLEYEEFHMITALSYPKSTLSKAVNYESKELRMYKNKPGKIIVIYDECEREAPAAATTLVERGYDNLFMLSGGIRMASKLFPEGLITGTVPAALTGVKPKQRLPATQRYFTQEDINALEMYLDNALQDQSVGSRLSKASTTSRMSKTSTARSTKCTSSSLADRPAFR